jgi:hypothetical protein
MKWYSINAMEGGRAKPPSLIAVFAKLTTSGDDFHDLIVRVWNDPPDDCVFGPAEAGI